jgi:integrase
MKVNFYLKVPNANYETWVYCLCRYDSKAVKVYSDKKISPEYWNKTDQRARKLKKFPTNPEFNHWLQSIADQATKLENEWKLKNKHLDQIPSLPEQLLTDGLKNYINKTDPEKREDNKLKTFWGYFDNLLFRMDNGTRLHNKNSTVLTPKTIFQYHNLKRHLEAFEKVTKFQIDFESIDMTFYKRFVDYATIIKNLKPNTIGKLITNLKVVLNEAVDDEINTNLKFKNSKFKSMSAKSETIYLTEYEINEMLAIDLTHLPSRERVRDIFIIGCYTGLRFSDLTKIQNANIENDFIEIVQTKTNEPVFIPLRPTAKELLNKYGNNIPKISNQRYNEYIQDVATLCPSLQTEITFTETKGGKLHKITHPKCELVSSHTARRSFATNEYKAGDLTITEIMSITGHKTEKAFYKYIRETPKDAAMRVKEKWAKRVERLPLLRAV